MWRLRFRSQMVHHFWGKVLMARRPSRANRRCCRQSGAQESIYACCIGLQGEKSRANTALSKARHRPKIFTATPAARWPKTQDFRHRRGRNPPERNLRTRWLRLPSGHPFGGRSAGSGGRSRTGRSGGPRTPKTTRSGAGISGAAGARLGRVPRIGVRGRARSPRRSAARGRAA